MFFLIAYLLILIGAVQWLGLLLYEGSEADGISGNTGFWYLLLNGAIFNVSASLAILLAFTPAPALLIIGYTLVALALFALSQLLPTFKPANRAVRAWVFGPRDPQKQ